jgi:hypothetical protein
MNRPERAILHDSYAGSERARLGYGSNGANTRR